MKLDELNLHLSIFDPPGQNNYRQPPSLLKDALYQSDVPSNFNTSNTLTLHQTIDITLSN